MASLTKLTPYEKQYTIDEQWLHDNKRKIAKAIKLLTSYLLDRSRPSRSELQRARALVDRANEIAREHSTGAPYLGGQRNLERYRTKRKSIKAKNLPQLGKLLGRWRQEINRLRMTIGKVAQPLQREELRSVSREMYGAADGLAEAWRALGEAKATIDRVEQRRKRDRG